jgi:hypothetical protein
MLNELAHHGPSLLVDGWGFSTKGKGNRSASFFVQFTVSILTPLNPTTAFLFELQWATGVAHNDFSKPLNE